MLKTKCIGTLSLWFTVPVPMNTGMEPFRCLQKNCFTAFLKCKMAYCFTYKNAAISRRGRLSSLERYIKKKVDTVTTILCYVGSMSTRLGKNRIEISRDDKEHFGEDDNEMYLH